MERRKIQLNRSITGAVLRVYWQHIKRYPYAACAVLASTIAIAVMIVIIPWYYKLFFDALANNAGALRDAVPELITILLVLTGLKTLTWCLRRVKGFTSVHFQTSIMRDLNDAAFRSLLRHSYRFFSDNFAGSLVRKANRLSRAFEEIVDQVEFHLLPLFIIVGGILIVLFRRHPLLGATLLIGVVVVFSLHIGLARWKQKHDLRRAEKDSEATGILSDALTNAVTIKLFSRYGYEESFYRKVINELKKLRAFTWRLNEWIDLVQGMVVIPIEFVIFYVAIRLWQQDVITVGDFALIQVYLMSLFDRMWEFGRVLRKIYEAIADAAEMVEIMDAPVEIRDRINAKNLTVTSGEIEFRDVTFAFQKTRPVLSKFTLRVAPGEKVALVGTSGAGKTTVAKLLLRFYDLTDGAILIDGQNIAEIAQESLWEHIAFVPQEPILFHRTLKENILYGRTDANEGEVIAAAKKARAHGFISSLPYGYETYVGERGIKLSGGERQRIAIARAILKNAPILVLDEATSSLDSKVEALIQEALAELMKEKTAMIIAHRLSTIIKMDRIVVVDNGKIITTGTHRELLQKEGIYKKLWEIQAGGFGAP